MALSRSSCGSRIATLIRRQDGSLSSCSHCPIGDRTRLVVLPDCHLGSGLSARQPRSKPARWCGIELDRSENGTSPSTDAAGDAAEICRVREITPQVGLAPEACDRVLPPDPPVTVVSVAPSRAATTKRCTRGPQDRDLGASRACERVPRAIGRCGAPLLLRSRSRKAGRRRRGPQALCAGGPYFGVYMGIHSDLCHTELLMKRERGRAQIVRKVAARKVPDGTQPSVARSPWRPEGEGSERRAVRSG